MKKMLKWSFLTMCAMVGMTFTSCDDDDDVVMPTVEEVNGQYAGTMAYGEAEPVALELEVANDSVVFAEFPYEALVEAVVGEDAAAGIIELIGKLEYKVAYKAEMNAACDSVRMTLEPETLNIPLNEAVAVAVTIESAGDAAYAVSEKNLKFNLKATEAKLGEVNALPAPIELAFDVKKK